MKILGKKQRPDQPQTTEFQPTVVIAAEIAFAALLLYMSNQPLDLIPDTVAQGEPVLTISIPANIAIASTEIAKVEPALIQP